MSSNVSKKIEEIVKQLNSSSLMLSDLEIIIYTLIKYIRDTVGNLNITETDTTLDIFKKFLESYFTTLFEKDIPDLEILDNYGQILKDKINISDSNIEKDEKILLEIYQNYQNLEVKNILNEFFLNEETKKLLNTNTTNIPYSKYIEELTSVCIYKSKSFVLNIMVNIANKKRLDIFKNLEKNLQVGEDLSKKDTLRNKIKDFQKIKIFSDINQNSLDTIKLITYSVIVYYQQMIYLKKNYDELQKEKIDYNIKKTELEKKKVTIETDINSLIETIINDLEIANKEKVTLTDDSQKGMEDFDEKRKVLGVINNKILEKEKNVKDASSNYNKNNINKNGLVDSVKNNIKKMLKKTSELENIIRSVPFAFNHRDPKAKAKAKPKANPKAKLKAGPKFSANSSAKSAAKNIDIDIDTVFAEVPQLKLELAKQISTSVSPSASTNDDLVLLLIDVINIITSANLINRSIYDHLYINSNGQILINDKTLNELNNNVNSLIQNIKKIVEAEKNLILLDEAKEKATDDLNNANEDLEIAKKELETAKKKIDDVKILIEQIDIKIADKTEELRISKYNNREKEDEHQKIVNSIKEIDKKIQKNDEDIQNIEGVVKELTTPSTNKKQLSIGNIDIFRNCGIYPLPDDLSDVKEDYFLKYKEPKDIIMYLTSKEGVNTLFTFCELNIQDIQDIDNFFELHNHKFSKEDITEINIIIQKLLDEYMISPDKDINKLFIAMLIKVCVSGNINFAGLNEDIYIIKLQLLNFQKDLDIIIKKYLNKMIQKTI